MSQVWSVDTETSWGSAVPIRSTGDSLTLVTCWHVVDRVAEGDRITVAHHQHGSFPAAIVWHDADKDLALLVIFTKQQLPVFRRAPPPAFGSTIFLVGYPGQQALTITQGTAQEPGRVAVYLEPGSSGGAVLDAQGRLVGIIQTGRSTYTPFGRLPFANIGGYIPISALH